MWRSSTLGMSDHAYTSSTGDQLSNLIPNSRISGRHSAFSACTNCVNCAGVQGWYSMPSVCIRAVISGGFTGLAIIGVLTSLISAFYYLRVVVNMYMREGDPAVESETWLNLSTGVTAVLTVALSLVPGFLFAWAYASVLKLF